MTSSFGWLDWSVMVGYLALVSVLGVVLAGKQTSMEDFFRGGSKLPWYAVSASLIATTISAVTFVGVPAVAFNPNGGNMTYLQLGLIAGLISRVFVSFILVPAYYRRRIYSPYDYMGNQLGEGARGVTTALFTLGGVLAQSARVYLTALVLTLVMSHQLGWIEAHLGLPPLVSAIVLVGIIAILWTMLGGIATVVWTDALLFLVFVTGGLAALYVVIADLPGGWSQYIDVARADEKFKLFDFSKAFSLTEPYTLVAAGFAVVIGNIGVYGTDQLLAQRIFCCKDKKNAQWAMLSSYAAEFIASMMLLVGIALYVFYTQFPEKLAGASALLVAQENDKVFPVFILEQMPMGIKGLVIAGIFAAAISSLTSILAALAQTTISVTYLPRRAKRLGLSAATEEALSAHDPREAKRIVSVSRVWIVIWGVVLCAAAVLVGVFKDATGVPILDLALALASYIVGGLFAAFLLAWLPVRINGRGLVWAAPLSVFAVVMARFQETWALTAVGLGCGVVLVTWVVSAMRGDAALQGRRLARTPWVVMASAIVLAIGMFGQFTTRDADGQPVLADAKLLDEADQPVIDSEPVPEPWRHPITKDPLEVDAERLDKVRYAMRSEDGVVLRGPAKGDELGTPKLQTINAQDGERPVFWVEAGGAPKTKTIAWPWYAPIGGLMALVFGYLLADRRESDPDDTTPDPPSSSPEDSSSRTPDA